MQSQKPSAIWQQEMSELSKWLLQREKANKTELSDYSFIIFPIAKAFEGFLKDYLFELELISFQTYNSRRFRIGRALNPDISVNQRDQWWLYDDVVHHCGSAVAKSLWQTWLQCRNHIFHYFPGEKSSITLENAEKRIAQIEESMALARQCILTMRN